MHYTGVKFYVENRLYTFPSEYGSSGWSGDQILHISSGMSLKVYVLP